jgi:GGDEF domain-containing protein
MYTPYVVGAYAAALLLLLVGLRVVGGSAPDLRGARQVHRYLLCALGSLFCFVLRIWIPAAISIVSTNSLAFASALFLYLAAAEIQQAQPRLMPWLTALCAAGLAGLSWMPSVGDRLLLHCAIMAVIFAAAAAVLYRRHDETLARPRQAAAILMTLAAAHQAFWAVMSALYPPGPDYLLHLSALQTGLSYLTTIMACANVAALMWLSLSVHRLDLHRAAQTDALTGLLNRRAFEEILSRELPRCIRTGRNLGAMMIDIDHFKRINDTLGHRAGDDVLRYVVSLDRKCLGASSHSQTVLISLLPRGIFDKETRRKVVAVAGAAMELRWPIGLHGYGEEAAGAGLDKAARQIFLQGTSGLVNCM